MALDVFEVLGNAPELGLRVKRVVRGCSESSRKRPIGKEFEHMIIQVTPFKPNYLLISLRINQFITLALGISCDRPI